jgi:hypothetical protein
MWFLCDLGRWKAHIYCAGLSTLGNPFVVAFRCWFFLHKDMDYSELRETCRTLKRHDSALEDLQGKLEAQGATFSSHEELIMSILLTQTKRISALEVELATLKKTLASMAKQGQGSPIVSTSSTMPELALQICFEQFIQASSSIQRLRS